MLLLVNRESSLVSIIEYARFKLFILKITGVLESVEEEKRDIGRE